MDNEKIGKFIRELRKEAGLTQKELADKLGVTDRAISKWERGLGCPDVSLLEDVAKALGVSILELLKGEHLEVEKFKDNDLVELVVLSKKMTINKFKNYFNLFTIIVVIILGTLIVLQNFKNMYFVLKKYDMEIYYVDNTSAMEELDDKYELILSTQGKYSDEDYKTISSYIKIMRKRLAEQNNKNYLEKENYNYFKVLSFYLEHQNFYTLEIDNMDLYEIILEYDTNVSENMISYKQRHDNLNRELSNILFFLEQPYFNYEILEFHGYFPNIYGIVEDIYENELMLCRDIIKVGGLYE